MSLLTDVNQLATDAALMHDIIHGGTTDTVITEGGTVPSVAKAIEDFQNAIGTGQFANGTVGAPAVSFVSDTDSGLYRIGANNIGVAVNGAKVLDVATTGLAVTGTLSATGASGSFNAISTATGTAFQTNAAGYVAQNTVAGREVPGLFISDGTNTTLLSQVGTTSAIFKNGTRVLDIASTGLAVTGTLSASGKITQTGDSALYEASAAGTAYKNFYIANTGGGLSFGVEQSAGGLLVGGSSGYDSVINTTTATNLRIGINNTIAGTFSSTGLAVTGLLDLSAASSGQIKFPATQNASADANTLDDYEEGTWTMGITFGGGSTGITYTVNGGLYTKIGRQVTVTGLLILSSKGSSTGDAVLTGLPFTIGNSNPNTCVPAIRFAQITFGGQYHGQSTVGATTLNLGQDSEAGTASSLTDANFANNSLVAISFTYFV